MVVAVTVGDAHTGVFEDNSDIASSLVKLLA